MSKHIWVHPDYTLQFNERKNDVLTCVDVFEHKSLDGSAVHILPQKQYRMDYKNNKIILQKFETWYRTLYNRLRLGGASLTEIETTTIEERTTKLEKELKIKRLMVKDEPNVKLNVFEIYKIYDFKLDDEFDGHFIDYYADRNIQVTFDEFMRLTNIFIEGLLKGGVIDIYRNSIFVQFAVYKYLQFQYSNASFRFNRNKLKGDLMVDRRWNIKAMSKVEYPRGTSQEDVGIILSSFKTVDDTIYDNLNRPFSDGFNDYCSVIEFLVYNKAIEYLKDGLTGYQLEYKLDNTFSYLLQMN